MNWSENNRSGFMLHLIELGHVSRDLMIDALYNALIQDHARILDNGVPRSEVKEAISSLIFHFEQKENYEYCHKLKNIEICL